MKNRFCFKLILTLCVIVALAGCDIKNNGELKIIDMAGDTVLLPDNIENVASTSNPCTNMLIALGEGDKLVASYKTIFDNPWFEIFYPNACNLAVLDSYQPEAESLISMGIDLIFVPTQERASALREKGICAVCIRFYSPDEIKQGVKLLGEIFGEKVKERGNKWIKLLDDTIKTIGLKWENIDDSEKPVAYEIIGDKYRGLFRTNYGTAQAWLQYGGGIIATKDFGDYNTAAPTEEEILETNPDIIFIGGTYSSQLKKDLFLDEKWKDIYAVKNNNVHIVPVGCCYWNDCTVEYPMIIYYVYSCMYPEQTDFSIKDIAHDFYLEYYEIDFNDEDMEKMMNGLAPNGEAICDQLRK
jgi:iron complex transport system substrate-binding protein